MKAPSIAVAERIEITERHKRAVIRRLVDVQTRLSSMRDRADSYDRERWELVERLRSGGVEHVEIANALGMTKAGVVKLIQRGRGRYGIES